jgi:hypothetical protein
MLKAIEKQFSLERELAVGLAEDLSSLTRFYELIVSGPELEFRAGRIVVMGLINHAHSLIVGGLQAVEAGNGAVWSACFRGLIETFGACVLLSERPGTAPNYLEQIKPGKLYSAAERAIPGLKGDLARLHQIVHPASGAIFAGIQSRDEVAKTAVFKFGLFPPSNSEAREGIIVLSNLADSLVKQFSKLASSGAVLSAGKVVMDRASKT